VETSYKNGSYEVEKMLTIKPEENFEYVKNELGIDIPDSSTVMVMTDGNTLIGAGVMELCDEVCTILGIYIKDEFADFSLEFGMGKSLLNTADLRGARWAVTDISDKERLLCALRFKDTADLKDIVPKELQNFESFLNLEGYFDTNCSNCTKE